jgi:hypothetical protein
MRFQTYTTFVLATFFSLSLSAAKKELSIVMLGKTGAGMSSLINIIYNHVMSRSVDEPRSVIIPLRHFHSIMQVNVVQFKKPKIVVRDRGSLTTEIRSYQFENAKYRVTFWDTPGFGSSDGHKEDLKNLDKLAEFLATTPVHSIAWVLRQDDAIRIYPEYIALVDSLRKLLPKSAIGNISGILNKYNLSEIGGYDTIFGEYFDSTSYSVKIPLYAFHGTTFFEKTIHQFSQHDWTRDAKTTERFLQETNTATTQNLAEVRRIIDLKSHLEDLNSELAYLFQAIEFQKSNLKKLQARNSTTQKIINACKAEVTLLEQQRVQKIQESIQLENELRLLAMKVDMGHPFVNHLNQALPGLDVLVIDSFSEFSRQKSVRDNWIETYQEKIPHV